MNNIKNTTDSSSLLKPQEQIEQFIEEEANFDNFRENSKSRKQKTNNGKSN